MKLSNKERRYRMKIIQENQYDKFEQRILDEAVSKMSRSYKDIYETQRTGLIYWFMVDIGSTRAIKAFVNAGNSFNEVTEAFGEFRKMMKELCEVEGS